MADDLEEFIDHHRITRPVLIGHSMYVYLLSVPAFKCSFIYLQYGAEHRTGAPRW